jgi:hypothetical protein
MQWWLCLILCTVVTVLRSVVANVFHSVVVTEFQEIVMIVFHSVVVMEFR